MRFMKDKTKTLPTYQRPTLASLEWNARCISLLCSIMTKLNDAVRKSASKNAVVVVVGAKWDLSCSPAWAWDTSRDRCAVAAVGEDAAVGSHHVDLFSKDPCVHRLCGADIRCSYLVYAG